ncbi:MAG: aminotransferase class I/II-fold pyridoxal phosphate-dependent enzyme [Actinomycetaceae bacterium]|nr:aminotransferase class I/II-fold pyridoxal phosphate-dependent enzyme [Actinomycetaceae bacterium]
MPIPFPRDIEFPAFPWDTIEDAKAIAQQHPDGIVDMSIGTPVDETPEVVQQALRESSTAAGYPSIIGSEEFSAAVEAWAEARGAINLFEKGVQAIPTIGSKEMIAWLAFMLGLNSDDRILIPECAYPTYEIGARIVGAETIPVGDDPEEWPDASMVWINSPGNPNGRVLSVDQLRKIVAWARERGAIVASDECYAALVWDPELIETGGVPSILSIDVCDGDCSNLLLLYSLSKQSNMAGYRVGFLMGDKKLVDSIAELRRHLGMMASTPALSAMCAGLRNAVDAFEWPGDGITSAPPTWEECPYDHGTLVHGVSHVVEQRARYNARRQQLIEAFDKVGLVNHPDCRAGLYLWLRDERHGASGRELLTALAKLGIFVAPGEFYGKGNEDYIRVSLSATDERVQAACDRLSEVGDSFRAQ